MITVADLSPYWSYPPTGGGPVRIYHLNNEVSKLVEVHQFSARPTIGHQQMGRASWIGSRSHQHNRQYNEYQYFDPLVLGSSYLLYRLGFHSDLYLSQVLRFLLPRMLKFVVQKSVIIQVEHPWLFRLAKGLAKNKPLIYVAHNVESALWSNPSWSPKSFPNVRSIEEEAIAGANAIVAMSSDDAHRLVTEFHAAPSKITIIPNGVNLTKKSHREHASRLEARRKLQLDSRPVFLFAGSDHYPNREAVHKIVEWQAQLGSALNIQFIVIGTVGRYFRSTEHLRVEGYVNDTNDFFLAADFALNPLVSGSGVSLKPLEYLSWGLPTISTAIGVRGLNLINEQDILIGDVSQFPAMMERMIKEQSLQDRLSQNGPRAIEQYQWCRMADKMLNLYKEVLN